LKLKEGAETAPRKRKEDTQMTATNMIKGFSGALVMATVLAFSAGSAQAADSNDRIVPPSPAEVAILRGLLALQHPSLRQAATATPAPVAATPTVAEPAQQNAQQS
jgi:hypothetical protein